MMSTATAPDISLGPTLTEEQAREIFAQGEAAVVFALLEMAKMLAEQNAAQAATSHAAPATPSGMKPPYSKPTARGRRKKPGRKPGHPGSRRPPPERRVSVR
jgi:transposase